MLRPLLVVLLLVALALVGCGSSTPAPATASSTSGASLVGTWGWHDDVEVFRADGTGSYYRGGELCFAFTWRADGDVMTTTADRDSSCEANRESSYSFLLAGGVLHMKHVGSGFDTEWNQAREPAGAGVVAADSAPPSTTGASTASGGGSKVDQFLAGGSAPGGSGGAAPSTASAIVGTWQWGDDIETFRADGTGTYVRDGSVCYEFRYTITGDVVSKVADRDSGCQGRRDNSYRFVVRGSELTMVHVGSSFESKWKRVSP